MESSATKIAVIIATILVYIVNYFAGSGQINGRDPGAVSDAYPTLLTPAGYAFTIWGLIYLGMLFFSIYQALPKSDDSVSTRVRLLYLGVCAANISWIFSWHYDLIPLSLAFMALLLGFLAFINVDLRDAASKGGIWFARVPFSIYFGWVTVAAILNIVITLVYFGVSLPPFAASLSGVFLIVAAVVIGVILRFRLKTMAYPLAIAWGITAIGVKQSGNTIVVLSAAFGMMTLIFFAFWGYVKDR